MRIAGLIPLIVLLTAPGQALVLLRHPVFDAAADGETLATINSAAFRGLEVVSRS
jgi:hypothetical protein